MPFTPESILKAIKDSHQTPKRGEEGILHGIALGDKRLYAKEWRGKHFEGEHIAPESYSYEDRSEMTPVSPFWFKLKYYEGLLLDTAFPGQTLRVHAAYDPRISVDEQVSNFAFGHGRPITITPAVESGSDAQKRRDELIDTTYNEYFAHFQPNDRGILKSKNMLGMVCLQRADWQMLDELGEEFMGQEVHWDNPTKTLHEWERAITAINPRSIIIDFLRSGLLPNHPTFNFIPTQERSERGAEGVFIEVVILDPELLRRRLLERDSSPEYQKQINWKINRYLLFKALDEAYDELFLAQHSSDGTLKHDPEILNQVFRLLERIRQRIEKSTDTLSSLREIQSAKRSLYWLFEDYSEKAEFLTHLEALYRNLI